MVVQPGITRVGFVGLGVMGQSMAGHVLGAGYSLFVHNRTRSKADGLIANGATWCSSPAALAEASDVVVTIVGYPGDVEQVYLGEKGILQSLKPGSIAVDMTTSSPELAQHLYTEGTKKSVAVLDAPVSGGDMGAREARLSIMVGGDTDAFDTVLPLLRSMGTNIVYQGPAGSGQHCKMSNQIAIAAGMVAVCESLAYAKRAGLDLATVLKSIGSGAAGSWSLNNLGPRIIAGNFEPGFYVKHFIKDMTIAFNSAQEMGVGTPGLALAKTLYENLAEAGGENLGTQGLYKLFGK